MANGLNAAVVELQGQSVAGAQQDTFHQVHVFAARQVNRNPLPQVALEQLGLADQVEFETLVQHAGSRLVERGKRHGRRIDQRRHVGDTQGVHTSIQ